jgi:hypothetical protein
MKRRTLSIAGLFARTAGLGFAGCLLVIAVTEGLNGICACLQSERET